MKQWRLRRVSALLATLAFALAAVLALPAHETEQNATARRHDAPSRSSDQAGPLGQRVASIVADYRSQGLFRGAVLVARAGEIVEQQAGLADEDRAEPITAASLFRLGSLSKHFAAVAALALEEQGKLDISGPVAKYLPEYPAEHLALAGKQVTIHHLLRHTSGLRSSDEVLRALSERIAPVPAARLVELLQRHPLEAVPGERYAYNNANYELLALIIARATGHTVEAELRGLFDRAGVSGVGVVPNERERPHLVRGYVPFGAGWLDIHRVLGVPYADFPTVSASGNLFGSARGLYAWLTALVDGRIIGASALSRMLTPGAEGYGYGLFIDRDAGWRRLSHTGSVIGFASRLEYYPDERAALIVLSNGDSETTLKQLTRDLRAALRSPQAPAKSHATAVPIPERALSSLMALIWVVFSPTGHGVPLQSLVVAWLLLGVLPKEPARVALLGAGIFQVSMLGLVLALAGTGGPITGLLELLAAGLSALGLRAADPAGAAPAGKGRAARRYLALVAAGLFAVLCWPLLGRLLPWAAGGALLGVAAAVAAPGSVVSRYRRELEPPTSST